MVSGVARVMLSIMCVLNFVCVYVFVGVFFSIGITSMKFVVCVCFSLGSPFW